MNLFCILVKYEKPLNEIETILPAHRAYLGEGYKAGFLLASGPQNPKIGGLIIGKFENKDAALKFTQNDPYFLNKLASYEIIEFSPVLHAQILNDFLGK